MFFIKNSGFKNLAFVQPDDIVVSIEDPANYTRNGGTAIVKFEDEGTPQPEATDQVVKREVEEAKNSPKPKSERVSAGRVDKRSDRRAVSRSLGGNDGQLQDSRPGEKTGIKLKFGKKKEVARPQIINCRYSGPGNYTTYHYKGKTYFCPEGKRPWVDKADLEDCVVSLI